MQVILSIFFAVLLLPAKALAQTVTLKNSTERSWTGGIAGRSGSDYTFSLEFKGFKNDPIPDTLWIENEPIPIVMSSRSQANARINRLNKNTMQLDINAGITRDEYERYHAGPLREVKAPPHHPPVKYSGVALLSYLYKGKKKYFVIGKMLTRYPPVAYP